MNPMGGCDIDNADFISIYQLPGIGGSVLYRLLPEEFGDWMKQ